MNDEPTTIKVTDAPTTTKVTDAPTTTKVTDAPTTSKVAPATSTSSIATITNVVGEKIAHVLYANAMQLWLYSTMASQKKQTP